MHSISATFGSNQFLSTIQEAFIAIVSLGKMYIEFQIVSWKEVLEQCPGGDATQVMAAMSTLQLSNLSNTRKESTNPLKAEAAFYLCLVQTEAGGPKYCSHQFVPNKTNPAPHAPKQGRLFQEITHFNGITLHFWNKQAHLAQAARLSLQTGSGLSSLCP